jgi:hypothetical protein
MLSAAPTDPYQPYKDAYSAYAQSLQVSPEEKNQRAYLNTLLGQQQQNQEKNLNLGQPVNYANAEGDRQNRTDSLAIDAASRSLDALTGYRTADTNSAQARAQYQSNLLDLQYKPIPLSYGGSVYYPGTGQTAGGFNSSGATNDLVSNAMSQGRLDPTLLTRYGLPYVLNTLQQNPNFDFNASHTGYERGIQTSTQLKYDPLTGQPVTYQTKGPAPSGASAPTSPSGLPAQPTLPGGTSGNAPAGAPAASGSQAGGGTSAAQGANLYATAPLPTPQNKIQLGYQKDLTTGATGKQINALNTAVGHLFDANNLFTALNNGAVQSGNSLKNFIGTQTGSAEANNYGQAQDLLSNEIANAYGAGALGDREAQKHYGSAIDSPDQHQGYVQTVATFLSSKIAANIQSYRTAMGQNPTSLDTFISPVNQVKLASLGLNVKGLVPGLAPSKTASSLIDNAHAGPDGTIYIPVDPSNPKGAYQKLQ